MRAADAPPADAKLHELEELGARLLAQGRMKEAADAFRERLRMGPANLRTVNGLGWASFRMKHFEALPQLADMSLKLDPAQADGWFFRGVAHGHRSEFEEGIRCLREAARIAPRSPPAHYQLGLQLQGAGRFDEALQSLDRAVELNPRHAGARVARAILLGDLLRLDEAIAEIDRLLQLQPGHAAAKYIHGELLLVRGDYARGWQEFDDSLYDVPPEVAHLPQWRKEPLTGRRLLVHSGVGLGDYLMYARFVPWLQARGASVVLHAPAALAALLQASFPAATVVTEGQGQPEADFRCSVMSLPRALQVGLETVPAALPYLRVPPEAAGRWEAKLGPRQGLRIGIVWSGRASRRIDRSVLKRRSMPLAAIGPLLQVPAQWHCLQQEIQAADLEVLPSFPQLRDHSGELRDFGDTAALAAAMDLVISTDTSVAHLAGGLGRPLWMMLPASSDFRWPFDRPSPWYPDAWMVRQESPGDWGGVVARIAARLRERQE